MNQEININLLEDGPIEISGHESISYCGNRLEGKEKAYLCRCGESSNPPFCDGAHKSNGFSEKNEVAQQKETRTWTGKTIKTTFNPNICMHAFKCQPLKALREREETGDASAAQEIATVVTTCPSGALSYQMIEGKNDVMFDSSGEIEIIESGEICIKTKFKGVERQAGQPENRLTLCRCGLSKNKPFCDASHRKKANFK